jgi:hypothetical protein
MSKRRAVQHLSQQPPVRQASVHYGTKPIIVFAHEQVGHFMHHDIFEALARLLRKFGVKPDAATARVAAPPFGFHPLHEKTRHFHAHAGSPLCESTTKEAATAVSAATKPVAGRGSLELANSKNEVAVELDKAPSIDVSAELPSAPVPPQRKSRGHRGGLRLAVYSVLAVLLILFSAGWAAISLGIIRITIQ